MAERPYVSIERGVVIKASESVPTQPAMPPAEPAKREDVITAMIATGKTREQAEAFLDILGSALKRRGWVEGQPLSQGEIKASLDAFLGEAP
jgi:hypothetical protein